MWPSRPLILVGIVVAWVILVRFKNASATDAKPPEQPDKGPGGKDYAHKAAKQKSYGEGDTQYWIFEPDEPAPESAPVVIFCHGWSAMEPGSYGPWINHIVKRGNIVIYPRYQANLATRPVTFTDNAVQALKDAFKELNSGAHVKPDLTRVATVGHSFGGVVCANLAAVAEKQGLPKLKAVMPVEPGSGLFGAGCFKDYKAIPADTLMLCVAGQADAITLDIDAKRFFRESTNVPKENKNLVVINSDKHGKPVLNADHFVPCVLGTGSPLQTYGLWKWFDALTDAAFFGKNREYALGNTSEQRFMGKWSDGTPVAEPRVVTEP
jgi:acetyl esterase/lipase